MDETMRRALAPTDDEIRALPLNTNDAVLSELLAGTGTRALDIGCGAGKFTFPLARLFKAVDGIDMKAGKIAEGAKAAAASGAPIVFREGSGEDLPYEDAAFDAAVFSNSLHHMPHPDIALREAARVLKPQGLLYIMEPVAAGTYHEATHLVNDETEVRTNAYRQLVRVPGMEQVREVIYRSRRRIGSFEQWLAAQIDMDGARKALYDARPEEVRQRFEAHADRDGGGFSFDQIFRVNLLRKTGLPS